MFYLFLKYLWQLLPPNMKRPFLFPTPQRIRSSRMLVYVEKLPYRLTIEVKIVKKNKKKESYI